MLASSPAVAIILVNYNGVKDTLACVGSLQQLDYRAFQIIMVDNASSGDDVQQLRASEFKLTVIEAGQNLGFSGGCNQGIREALKDEAIQYIWLLNNDTLVEADTLNALMQTAEAHPQALIGSVVYHPDGRFQRIGNHINPLTGRLTDYTLDDIPTSPKVQCLTGCSMFFSRGVYDQLGPWDEGYFLYFEDNDYCLRAAQQGIFSYVSLKSRVLHHEGATTGKNRPLVTYYYQRNRLKLARKYFTPMARIWLGLYTRFRLFRSTIKTGLSRDPEKQRHHRAFQLAVQDFKRGVEGPCPHKI